MYPAALTATAGAPAAILPTVAGVAMIPSGTLPPVPSEITEMTPTAGMIGGGSIDPPSGSDPHTPAPTPLPAAAHTPTPAVKPGSSTPAALTTQSPPILYYTQAGDTLMVTLQTLRRGSRSNHLQRFGCHPPPHTAASEYAAGDPPVLDETSRGDKLFPDSEIIYSPSAIGFDAGAYVADARGYLAEFKEWRTDGWYNGGSVVQRVAYENSVNPRLLLALVEYQSHWIFDFPPEGADTLSTAMGGTGKQRPLQAVDLGDHGSGYWLLWLAGG